MAVRKVLVVEHAGVEARRQPRLPVVEGVDLGRPREDAEGLVGVPEGRAEAQDARKVFQDVQLDEDSVGSTEVGGGSDSMIYPEFLESLGAIAVYKNTNPYISLKDKLETFLTNAQTGFITCLNTAIKKDKKKLKLATSAASATNKTYASHGGRAAMAVIKTGATPRTPGRSARGHSPDKAGRSMNDEGTVTKGAEDRPWEDEGDRDKMR